ncbi:3-phenylpropionate/trans-cinnamate dioxygenase ferredoxin subunit [Phyllobacterium trifolii]|uniref:3-phenylpropionate/trans-cinnamate dioxygenase ferredoxin subunit n=1 Tax=Phyllobacterium trifolii TaxID=300193 RepID=A0A839UM90_9HYPH|nr:Rieske (2Fe-2S) protein [Phyllobacterium trifolii]MBB3149609.1 3-phenylpropionate/trans-cinnamate dioxygenase ferredoxin subunit [Phyllobacterium trifolii]
MARYVVASVDDIGIGERKLVDVRGRPVVVFNINGEFFALLDRCPHQGGSLCAGKMTGLVEAGAVGEFKYSRHGEIVRCPWHGWEFDVRTGKSYCNPERLRVRQFPVTLEAGAQVVEGPFVAETFQVTVEDKYVVIEA